MAPFSTREEFVSAMDQVVAGLNENAALKARLASANASLGLVVSDLPGAEYVMGFQQGQVVGSPDGAGSATVTITMVQDVLDRIFSGKLSGESAYFNGQVRLRGDEWTAEGFAGYIAYMVPLYVAATSA